MDDIILTLSIFFIVRANVRTDNAIITKVKRKPQQLDVSGSALRLGLAPKMSKNLTNYLR